MNQNKLLTSKHNSTLQIHTGESQSLTNWLLIILTFLFLFIAPFDKALFNGGQYSFERPIITTVLWGAVALAVVSIRLFRQWRLESWREALQIFVWLIPFSYLISLASAASTHSSKMMIYISVIYAAAFVIGSYMGTVLKWAIIIRAGIMGSAYLIVIFGFMNWFGDASLFGLFNWSEVPGQVRRVYNHAVMIDANGERLTSVFQYANTYAGYLIAVLLFALTAIATSKRWYWAGAHSLFLIPIMVSFLLTLSRGGIVIFPVVLLCILPFLKMSRQLLFFIHFLIAAAGTLIVLSPVTQIGLAVQKNYSLLGATKGWFILIGASLMVAILSSFIQKYASPWLEEKCSKWDKKLLSSFIFPIVAIVAGSILVFLLLGDTSLKRALPENIQLRIDSINLNQHSVLERGTFYKDAMKVITDHPVIGLGGGAWAAIYEKYQNNPYTSRQAHNFYLQYAIEVGILGFIIFTIFIVSIFYFYIRHFFRSDSEQRYFYLPFLIIAVTLLIHSALDFNMSYMYLGILLFLCLGCMISGIEFVPSAKFQAWSDKPWGKIYPTLTAVISIVILIVTIPMLNSGSYYSKARAALSSGDANAIFQPLDQALKASPYHPEYNLLKINILNQLVAQENGAHFESELVTRIKNLKLKEPYNRFLYEYEYQHLVRKGEFNRALELAKHARDNFRWDISILESIISLEYELGRNQDPKSYWDEAIRYYDQILAQIEELKKLPEAQLQGSPFAVTDPISLAIGRIYYSRGDYANSTLVYHTNLSDQFTDENKRLIARWYLASLHKQGKTDEAIYNKLITAFPEEKDILEKLKNN